MRRLIIFLIRKKLRLRKYQRFRFQNQRSATESYFFTNEHVMKTLTDGGIVRSSVSLNWLLSSDCIIDTNIK